MNFHFLNLFFRFTDIFWYHIYVMYVILVILCVSCLLLIIISLAVMLLLGYAALLLICQGSVLEQFWGLVPRRPRDKDGRDSCVRFFLPIRTCQGRWFRVRCFWFWTKIRLDIGSILCRSASSPCATNCSWRLVLRRFFSLSVPSNLLVSSRGHNFDTPAGIFGSKF